MENLDKNFDGLENNSQKNKDISEEAEKNVQASQDSQESEKEGFKEPEIEIENNEKQGEDQDQAGQRQGKADAQEGESAQTQEKTTEEEAKADSTVKEGYSTYYQPPYYVPNFTVSDGTATDSSSKTESGNKEKKNNWKIVLISALVLLVLLFTFVCGSYASSMMYIWQNRGDKIDMSREELNVVKNSPKLDVVYNTDVDYEPQSLPEVVAKVGNSVVEITTSRTTSDKFFGQYVTSGAGSGVIVAQSDEAGYLLTNYHVIHDDSGKLVDSITVILANGDQYSALEIGSDYSIDLSVIRIEKKTNEAFTVANWGDSESLVVGQEVIAIGNPLGSLGGTVTDGIISALDRYVNIDGVSMSLLQHNAAINPGNSGGGLFDMMGNLVGVVNAKQSDTGIEGLGFAIPVDVAFKFFNRVMVKEPAIGIRVEYGTVRGVYGVYVVSTQNDSFNKLDKIVKINDTAVEVPADYYAVIDCIEVGESFTITVERSTTTGKTQQVINLTMQ